jgi:sporulation protein YlmC with PRC-barrel domain
MRKITSWLAVPALALVLAAMTGQPAVAGDRQDWNSSSRDQNWNQNWNDNGQDQTGASQMGMDQSNMNGQYSPALARAEDLLDSSVKGRNNKDIGEVEDIVLGPSRSDVAYVVVSSSGTLGLGATRHAIPLRAFTVTTNEDGQARFSLDITRKQMEAAKGFEADAWPEEANTNWENSSGSRSQATEPVSYLAQRRVSKILDEKVASPAATDLGQVNDLIIDLNDGRVAYLIVDVNGDALDINGDEIAVPWHAVQPRQDELFVQADNSALQDLAFNGDLDRLENRAFAMQLHQSMGLQPYWEQPRRYGGMSGMREGRNVPQQGEYQQPRNRPHGPAQEALGESVTLTGEVVSVRTNPRNDTLNLTIRTDEGRTITIDAGPAEFAQRNGMRFQPGDRVTVQGRVVVMADNIKGGQRVQKQ